MILHDPAMFCFCQPFSASQVAWKLLSPVPSSAALTLLFCALQAEHDFVVPPTERFFAMTPETQKGCLLGPFQILELTPPKTTYGPRMSLEDIVSDVS